MFGTLFVVATPIGNLQDITFRAIQTLSHVDSIVCEDTRITAKLLAAHHLSKPLLSLHEHTSTSKFAQLIERMKNGANLAYVVDAGTPGVNDPGGKLVHAARKERISVVPIPGASALTSAISVCGFPMDEFLYLGFVPHKKGRQKFFRLITETSRPVIVLESTHRIMKTMRALSDALDPSRLVFVGRELTKLYETLYCGTAQDVSAQLVDSNIKGEFIIIVGPARRKYTVRNDALYVC